MRVGDDVVMSARASSREPSEVTGWRAALALEIGRDALDRSRVRSARHEGPLRVQRSFHPEGADGACHVYVLHPPGGVVDGDTLELDVRVAPRAAALLTTPGATKLYRARGARTDDGGPAGAVIAQRFAVAGGASLEWLPHETIVFAGARARTRTAITLAEEATYAGWELLCLGRPAAAERFTEGALRTELSITRGDKLVYFERGRFEGGDSGLDAPWGLAGQPVLGTFVLAAPEVRDEWLECVRDEVTTDDGLFAVTRVSGLLIARYLGGSTRVARDLFERALTVLRPLYAGRAAVFPRIWST